MRTSTFIVVDHLTVKVRCSMGGRIGIPLTILTLPHFCAYPKPLPEFSKPYLVICFVFTSLKWEVVVCFVDFGGIVDHHCVNFLFILLTTQSEGEMANICRWAILVTSDWKTLNLCFHALRKVIKYGYIYLAIYQLQGKIMKFPIALWNIIKENDNCWPAHIRGPCPNGVKR